ncbi:MAG: response regulator [Verrucomicrobia bacterium]|nr:response regulator [Verrucomicrobiota bacterium]
MRPKILAVDDSKAVRLIIQKALAPFACEVIEATNGFKGLFAMESEMPALILLDVSMPTMDGVEMLTLLKSHPELKKIPVIMLTSTSDHLVLPKITALGVNDQLRKPFTDAALLEKVQAILDLKPAPAGGGR